VILGNLRMGFATNSSSTHSIIIVKDPTKVIEQYYGCEFGRNTFVLKKAKNKLDYLAGVLFTSYSDTLGEVLATLLVKNYIEDRANDDLAFVYYSSIPAPLTRDSKNLDQEFVAELKEFISNKDVIILGMDDCIPDENNPLINIGTEYQDVEFPYLGSTVWAKKQNDGWWTLFSRQYGDKVTFNFNKNAPPLLKARTPDLVDLKITDYCETGCAYCYQGSTKKGKHAKLDTVLNFVAAFSELEVLEVAIGGGEPTKHPHLVEILEAISKSFMVPNFSTKSLDWMNDPAIVCAVDKYVGKVGFSCSSYEDLRALIYHVDKSGLGVEKISVHYVIGSCPMEELRKILYLLAYTGFDLLLLGYKETGRGSNFTPYDNSDIWNELTRHVLTIGIDTCAAKKYTEEIKKLKVLEYMYNSEEGKFSMYVDAVESKVSKSSYEPNPEDYKIVVSGVDDNWPSELFSARLFLPKNLMRVFNEF
jgi:hypothetical protein